MFYMNTEYEKKTKNFLLIILKKHRFWNKMSPRTSNVVIWKLNKMLNLCRGTLAVPGWVGFDSP